MTATVAEEQSKGISPDQAIVGLIEGLWLSRAVYTAATFGIADRIGPEPRAIEDLARDLDAHPGMLYRLMRALAAGGYFTELPGARFGHTPLSRALRSDGTGSIRWTAISELGADHYAAWEDIEHSLKTGETAFVKRFGMPVWQYYAEHAETGETFNRSMNGITERLNEAIVSAYSFSPYQRILDIGGGQGALLERVLLQNRFARGILFDQPQVLAQRASASHRNGAAARIEAIAGDFFEAVPEGADLHILKWIVHDWDDDAAVRILNNCRRSLAPGGHLLLIESMVPPANQGLFPKLMDLNMMVMTGGRERTRAEYTNLLARSGFHLRRVLDTESPVNILEAEPV